MHAATTIFGEIKRLFTHSAVYGIAAMGSTGISMILVPLYVHMFTPEEFGQLQLIGLWLSIVSTISGLGLTQAYFKAYHQYDSETDRQDTLGMTIILASCGAGLGCVIFLGLSIQPFTDHFAPLHEPLLLLVVLACLTSSVVLPIPFQVFRVQEQPLRYVKLVGVGLLVNIILSFVFVWWFAWGVKGVFAVQVSSATLMILLASFFLVPHIRFTLILERVKEILLFGLPFVPAAIALWVLDASDRILLERFYGVSEVGVYALGQKYSTILMFAVSAFQAAWAPHLFSIVKQENAPQLISRILTFVFSTSMILATFLYVMGNEVLSLIASEEYAGAHLVIAPLLLGFLFYGLYYVTVSYVYIHGRSGSMVIVVGIAATLNIVLNILFIPPLGGIGAAWATAFSYLVLAGMMYRLTKKHLPTFYLEYRSLGICAISCVVVALASDYILLDGLGAWLAQLGVVCLIPVILWFSDFVTPSERQQIQGFANSLKWMGNRG